MLRVTPIYGSRWSSVGEAEEPSCVLVQYGGCRVLWNCGYRPDFPSSLPEHDALIITDSSLACVGGLPLYYKHMSTLQSSQRSDHDDTTSFQKVPPIYATFPTTKMGQMTLYDLHASLCLDGGRPPFSLQDIDNAFSSIHSIKYSQPMYVYPSSSSSSSSSSSLSNNSNHSASTAAISIVAHRAGTLVGNALYCLQRLQDETLVVLTSKYHIAKELHLDGSTLLQNGSSPDVLVCHPGGVAMRLMRSLAHTPALPSLLVTQAERNLTETVMSTLRRDGNVLLPVDASGRVLELVLLLNRHWERQRLTGTYNLVWLGPMVQNTIEFARSQLEWMAGQLGTEFDSMAGHPFQLRAVQLCSSMRELETVISSNQNPTCVLASGLTLEGGPARDVFIKWAENPDNAIVFTDSSQCYLRSTWYGRAAQVDATMSEVPVQQSTASATMHATSAAASAGPVPIELDPEETEQPGTRVGEQAMVGEITEQESQWTTAGQLLTAWAQAKLEKREMDDFVAVDVKVPRRVPLVGHELKVFLAREEDARQQQKEEEEAKAMLRQIELARGQLRLDEQEGTSSVMVEQKSNLSSTRPKKKSRFDSKLFMKYSKPLHLTFEAREEAAGIGQLDTVAKYGLGESISPSDDVLEDDYGISVVPERFTDIVSGVDPSKFGSSGRIGEDVMRRGLGYGVEGKSGRGKSFLGGAGTRVSEDEALDDDDDELDEDALEAVDLSEGYGIIRGRSGQSPAKVTTLVRKLEVQAEISFVPLEGRVDARAARQSVRALQPRQVVVLGGRNLSSDDNVADEVTQLADAAKLFVSDRGSILAPSDGETSELSVGHAAYAVRVVDAPYMSRNDKEAGRTPLNPAEPVEATLGSCTVSLLDSVATGQKVALDGSIVLAPRCKSTDDSPQIYLSDGEVLLTDLRTELIAVGLKAEYSTHQGYSQLVVNHKIIVRKASDSGVFEVEGPLCEDFYTVRSFVCGQFVTL